ncbi:hypothetical protein [Escherichia phage PH1062]|nr:hypothetical protein [Escherichia phage PH1062]
MPRGFRVIARIAKHTRRRAGILLSYQRDEESS